jgi:hypothetical protein
MSLFLINIGYLVLWIFLICTLCFIAWKFSKSKKIATATVFSLLGLSALGMTIFSDPLVSDEMMIENFKNNRAAFQELVASYYKDGQRAIVWRDMPRVIELKQITGVEQIINGPSHWLENPYSPEAAEKLEKMLDEKLWDQLHERKSLIIKMPVADGYGEYPLYSVNKWKDYFYFPVDPMIENNRLVRPRKLNGPAKFQGDEVFDSLNSFPRGENDCALRKIEPHWFIRRCHIR